MQKAITIAAAAMFLSVAGIGLASAGSTSDQGTTIQEMRQKIDALGYDVRSLKVDDGVFKALIVDRQSGGIVKATFDVANGELVRAELR